jgi:hypothetical protein
MSRDVAGSAGLRPQTFEAKSWRATSRRFISVAPSRPQPIRTNTRTNCSGFQGLYLQTLSKRAYLSVEDADALYAEYASQGVEFTRKLGNTPWRERGFVVKDCDGRLLAFGANL